MSTDMDTAGTTDRRKRRRTVVVLKFGLAGAALLGIAAAATSAAWTDNAWFSASASAKTVQFDASNDNSHWAAADASGTAVAVLDPNALTGLVAGQSRPVTLYIKNNGGSTLSVAAPAISGDAITALGIGANTDDLKVAFDGTWPLSLAPNSAATKVTVTVTAPDTWPATFEGKSGTLYVDFLATATS